MKTKLLMGESKHIEYKEIIPYKSDNYMRTVVAFANGDGGKLVFGVKDDTCEIKGIEEENIFKKIDGITNTIIDSCQPTIVPEITTQTINRKTIIIVEILPGRERPYYIKSLGIEKGVFIRVSATTRQAPDYTIKELMFEGSNRYFDQSIRAGYEVSNQEIDDLCASLNETAIKNSDTKEEKNRVKDLNKNILLSWGLLTEKDGKLLPTNSFALLSGNTEIISTKIQCAVFKGKTRAIFIDRREFTGPLHEQFEKAYEYVLSKINLGAKIEGRYRQDIYEFPLSSLREVIANAIVHRSYLEPANIQVALYDDRLEITSPGMLLSGVSLKKMREGYSKIRNRGIANAFHYMKIIELWGSGIPRVFEEFKTYGLQEPELIDFDGDFRINLYRKIGAYSNDGTNGTNDGTNGTNEFRVKENIMELINENPNITQNQLSAKLNMSLRNIKRFMSEMQKEKLIKRVGSSRAGKWITY